MSFDLAVLDKYKRFERKEDFYDWLEKVTSWDEDLDYVFLWIYRFSDFSQKRFFVVVDYYSSMANARVGNDGSSCIEKSSRVDWKGVGGDGFRYDSCSDT